MHYLRLYNINKLKLKKTLFDKLWDSHVVSEVKDGPSVIFIDRHLVHEVTSPQAFKGIEDRDLKVLMPERTLATPDHNVPTFEQHLPISDELSRMQVDKLEENCSRHGIKCYGLNKPYQGIVHVIGPELGYTLPGMTIVCGDSHTSTHGAFGSIAFGIGTSEVEMVFASQCIMQVRPKTMRINIDGTLNKGVVAKDVILYVISQISTSGGTGFFVEYAGSAIKNMSMEERMTVCNMSIEMGARGGLIAPDETTFEYIRGRKFAPAGEEYNNAVDEWKSLFSDSGVSFDMEYTFDANDIAPMITYGTNPGFGIGIDQKVPSLSDLRPEDRDSFAKSQKYMNIEPGTKMLDRKIDYVFLGSCTNGRIEDLRQFASFVKGKQKNPDIVVWIVPGSKQVEQQAMEEGLVEILNEAGFEFRQPGCSACLAMNEDKIPPGKYSVSTSNRNFEGRQGPGSRTLLASPLSAAAAAISGKISDPRRFV